MYVVKVVYVYYVNALFMSCDKLYCGGLKLFKPLVIGGRCCVKQRVSSVYIYVRYPKFFL